MPFMIPLDPAVRVENDGIEMIGFAAGRMERGLMVRTRIANGHSLRTRDCDILSDTDKRAMIAEAQSACDEERDIGPAVWKDFEDIFSYVEHGLRVAESRYELADDDEVHVEAWPARLGHQALISLPGNMVRGILPHTEADPAAILLSFLAMAGAYIGNLAHTVASGSHHSVNEFILIAGETSTGRKGSSLGHLRSFFAAVDPDWSATRFLGGLSSGEGLISAVRDPSEKVDAHGDPTDAGITDKRTVVIEPEFAAVLRVMGREGNTISTIIRQAWDGGTLATMTRNSPLKAHGAHISILGHITQADALRYLASVDANNGFANRFLWCCSTMSKYLPDGGGIPDLSVEVEWMQSVRKLALTMGGREMRRTPDAAVLWRAHYERLSTRPDGLLGVLTGRAAAHVLRLSTLYALLDQCVEIDIQHIEAALEVWRYCEDSVRWVFGVNPSASDGERILAALREKAPDRMTRTEVSALFGHHAPRSRVDAALRTLLEGERIDRVAEPSHTGKGRYVTYYALSAAGD